MNKSQGNINKSTALIMFLIPIACFEVSYLYTFSDIFKYLYLGLQCIIIAISILVTLKNGKVSIFTILLILFIFIELFATFINGISFLPLIFNTLKLLLLYLSSELGLNTNVKLYIKYMARVLFVLTIANTLSSLLTYPEPLYYDLSDKVSPLYLIGGDNTSIRIYILTSMFCILNVYKNNKGKLISILSIINIFIFSFLHDLGTGKICSIIMLIGIILYIYNDLKIPKNVVKKCILINTVLFFMLVVSKQISAFSYIITRFLNRDLTLTSRTVIWEITLNKIKEKMFFGNGYLSGQEFERMLPDIIGVNAHNTYLMILFIGGGLLFAIFLIILLKTANMYDKKQHDKLLNIMPIALFTLMIRAQVEGGDAIYIIFILYLLYSYKKIENKELMENKERKDVKMQKK